MQRRTKLIAAVAVVLAAGGIGAGAVAASSGDDREPAIGGDALVRASAVALDHTGGGRVTDTEVGDEEGYYEVEVTLDGGGEVDVHLDRDFKVLGAEAEGADGEAGDTD